MSVSGTTSTPLHTLATEQRETPYTDAVRAYADRPMVRIDVPGHAGQGLAQPELAALFGEDLLRLDVPPLVDGVDQGPAPTPMLRSAELASRAWGVGAPGCSPTAGPRETSWPAWPCEASGATWLSSAACTPASWTTWCSAVCGPIG